jgi:hypothetical protein
VPHCTVVPDSAQFNASGPEVCVADTNVVPAGTASVSCTALNGCDAVNDTVYCKFGDVDPGVTVVGPALVIDNGCTIVAVADAE